MQKITTAEEAIKFGNSKEYDDVRVMQRRQEILAEMDRVFVLGGGCVTEEIIRLQNEHTYLGVAHEINIDNQVKAIQ